MIPHKSHYILPTKRYAAIPASVGATKCRANWHGDKMLRSVLLCVFRVFNQSSSFLVGIEGRGRERVESRWLHFCDAVLPPCILSSRAVYANQESFIHYTRTSFLMTIHNAQNGRCETTSPSLYVASNQLVSLSSEMRPTCPWSWNKSAPPLWRWVSDA